MKNKNDRKKKLKFYPTEVFEEISFEGEEKLVRHYAISNFGRFVSYSDRIEYGLILKIPLQDGYKLWSYRYRDDNNKIHYKYYFLYKLVAEYFIPKTSEDQVYVLHLNYNRADDRVENLRWATRAEMIAHGKKSPFVIAARKKQLQILWAAKGGRKLTDTQVILLKKKLLDPNRKTRMKILARQFGVTEMQLHRIKTGENWGDVKVR